MISIRRLFWAQTLFGLCVIGWGLVVPAMMPYVMLDVVLTPAELQDVAKHDSTLVLLKKVNYGSTIAIASGVFMVVVSTIGLRLSHPNTPMECENETGIR